MQRLLLTLAILWVANLTVMAQQRVLDHDDFARWKTIENESISADGRWVIYTVQPGEGDPMLYLYDGEKKVSVSFARGDRGALSADSRFAAFLIKPSRDSLLEMRRRKVKRDDLPKDTLAILELSSGQLRKIPAVKSFRLPEKWAGWLAYHHYPRPAVADSSGVKPKKESNDNGAELVIMSLADNQNYRFTFVKSYTLAEEASRVVFTTTGDNAQQAPGVYWFDGTTRTVRPLFRGKGTFQSLTLNKKGDQAAFVADTDTTKAPVRPWKLYHWRPGPDSARLVTAPGDSFLPEGWTVSPHQSLTFARDGGKLFFGIAPPPILPDTTLLDEEIVQVEVWTTQDPLIYPMQQVQLDDERKRAYLSVLHVATGKLVRLADETIPEIQLAQEGNSQYVLGYDEQPYLLATTWEGGPARKDLYLIYSTTGERRLIAQGVRCYTPVFSPAGRYAYWYNVEDTAWVAFELKTSKLLKIGNNQKIPFYDELNDSPDFPSPYGIAGWTTNDDFVIIYDRYDAWLIDPRGSVAPNNLTKGRNNKTIYRYIRYDSDERAIEEVKPMLFHVTEEDNKQEGYVWFNLHTGTKTILQRAPFAYSNRPMKATKADRWVFTRENYLTFPNLLYSTDLKTFDRVSDANPQQQDYQWGSIELVEWTSLDGQPLRGLLVKPDNFDPSKQYPMIVNFYERSTDGLHNHRAPVPNRSQIVYSFYASRGYLVFNPDIPYKIGYPGESALNAVVSGTTHLIDQGFVDKDRIGIQGHSWGGYQIAYLLTKTNLFRCAEAGAPVVNMPSAYGGIRWGTGMSRMFQYEHTQSRIGGTLWEMPLRFLENSPLFFADKITTPVLILHNDADSAVPWYQGIEFYMALRRLGKPAWMLNYNGEPHWPVKLQNRKDFQKRMQQFFDFYLQDAPKPSWMERGVPAIEKGIKQGY